MSNRDTPFSLVLVEHGLPISNMVVVFRRISRLEMKRNRRNLAHSSSGGRAVSETFRSSTLWT